MEQRIIETSGCKRKTLKIDEPNKVTLVINGICVVKFTHDNIYILVPSTIADKGPQGFVQFPVMITDH